MFSHVWQDEEPVNQDWGYTTVIEEPLYNGRHWHCGIDIGGPGCEGKSMFAARAGKVTWYSQGILGVTVAGGQIDWYVHGLYSVAWNQLIAKGQRLGAISNVVPRGGASFGAHLHFEVQPVGGWINVPTGLNPVPVLTGEDMDARQNDLLIAATSQLLDIAETKGPPAIPTKLAEILAAIKAIQASLPTPAAVEALTKAASDLTAAAAVIKTGATLSPAQATQLTNIEALAGQIKAKLDKDLA